MLATARKHFDADTLRARALLHHAKTIPASSLHNDILRSAWMMGVGAVDAYFSDAYADLISRTLRAKDLDNSVVIPNRLNNLRVPVVAILRGNPGGWRWRMAARELIENENVLSLAKIKSLFSHFYRENHKLLTVETIEPWILHPDSKHRLFGFTRSAYRNTNKKGSLRKAALEKFGMRFETLFQRRHDCIHNCDRPKVAPQQISYSATAKCLADLEFLVGRFEESMSSEFSTYLSLMGCSKTIRAQVLA